MKAPDSKREAASLVADSQSKPAATKQSQLAIEMTHVPHRSPGVPLTPRLRQEMESRLSHNFGDVRIHSDDASASAARSLDASAFAVGNDIYFDRGRFSSNTPRGRGLLAHELAHVVQQRAAVQRDSASSLEQSADQVASGFLSSHAPVNVEGSARPQIALQNARQDRGFAGEQAAGFAEFPAEQGWLIIRGPGGSAGHRVNAPGEDTLAFNTRTKLLAIHDNKSFASTRNVAGATAIDPERNLLQNLDDMINHVKTHPSLANWPHKKNVLRKLQKTKKVVADYLDLTPAQRRRTNLRLPGKVQLVVSNHGGRSRGLTRRLRRLGITFWDKTAPAASHPQRSRRLRIQTEPDVRFRVSTGQRIAPYRVRIADFDDEDLIEDGLGYGRAVPLRRRRVGAVTPSPELNGPSVDLTQRRRLAAKPKLKLRLPSAGSFVKGIIIDAAVDLAFQVIAHEIGKRMTLPKGVKIDVHRGYADRLLKAVKPKIDQDLRTILQTNAKRVLDRQVAGHTSYAVISYSIVESPDNPMGVKQLGDYHGARFSLYPFSDVKVVESPWTDELLPHGRYTTYTYSVSTPIAFSESQVSEYVDDQAAALAGVSPVALAGGHVSERFSHLADHISSRISQLNKKIQSASSEAEKQRLEAERERLKGLLDNVLPHEAHHDQLKAAEEKQRKAQVLKEWRQKQTQVVSDVPDNAEGLIAPPQPGKSVAPKIEFLSGLWVGNVDLRNAGKVADIFEAQKDELVRAAETLRQASRDGSLSTSDYKSQYQVFMANQKAWRAQLKYAIGFFEGEGGRFSQALYRLQVIEDWLIQADGQILVEVPSTPSRVRKSTSSKSETIVASDKAPMVPAAGGANITLAINTPVVPLSKPKGSPPFVKIRVASTGKVGWIQPRFLGRRK